MGRFTIPLVINKSLLPSLSKSINNGLQLQSVAATPLNNEVSEKEVP